MARKTRIFTIYAWEDKNAMLQLLRHLKPLEKDFDLSFWNDDPINAGYEWKPQDETRLTDADIFLLLVSTDFMNSEFIKQLEFKNIIDRYKENEAVVIPIILEYCQWEIDFKSDEYDFNLNELQVLPDDGKPLENWASPDKAFINIAGNVNEVLNSLTADKEPKGFKIEGSDSIGKDQIAMNFSGEGETKIQSEAAYLTEEELQSKRDAEEQQRLETIKKAEEELELKKQAEEKLRAEEELRLLEEDEARRRVEQELGERAREEAEAKRRTDEEKRLLEEAETQKRIEEENRINSEVEAEARRIEEQHRLKEEEYQEQYSSESSENAQETESEENTNSRKRILAGGLIALLAIFGIWAFSKFDMGADEPESYLPDAGEVEVKGPPASSDQTEVDSAKEEDFSKMLVGDTHDGGIIFTIDYINKTGKIAHIDDAGPMPWKEAVKIDEQLGEGWRLPTMDELRLMHKAIGQGSDNKGEFVDELYWSATPYDNNQARLVRFSDGNTSYHYNSRGTHRKFLVRAIRDFSR